MLENFRANVLNRGPAFNRENTVLSSSAPKALIVKLVGWSR